MNLGPLEDQDVFLTPQPPLQPPGVLIKSKKCIEQIMPLGSPPELGNSEEKNQAEAFSQGRLVMKTPQDTQRLIRSYGTWWPHPDGS